VSAIAAVAAAVAAPLSAYLVALANNRHDRWVKTYSDLRDAYVRLLSTIARRTANAATFKRMLEVGDIEIFTENWIEEDRASAVERQALIGAFAAETVSEALDAWETEWRAVNRSVIDSKHGTPDERRESAEAIDAAMQRTREPLRRLQSAIRTDLRNQRK
jgi:hypothetical protein